MISTYVRDIIGTFDIIGDLTVQIASPRAETCWHVATGLKPRMWFYVVFPEFATTTKKLACRWRRWNPAKKSMAKIGRSCGYCRIAATWHGFCDKVCPKESFQTLPGKKTQKMHYFPCIWFCYIKPTNSWSTFNQMDLNLYFPSIVTLSQRYLRHSQYHGSRMIQMSQISDPNISSMWGFGIFPYMGIL